MVWKIVILAVAVVLSSIVIGGAIIVSQVLANGPNIDFDDDKSPQQEPPSIEGVKVSIVDNSGSNSYDPSPIEVKAGDTVTWVNDDSSRHTVTSGNGTPDGTFDSNMLRQDETFSFVFDREGEFPYYCTLHPNMKGTVVVNQNE